jgi:LysR family glycine cleavage system transcriptional activator
MADPLASIPLAAIRVFDAAARLRSFTRAAEALGMTQAAVSWQVKALEGRLGQALFVRRPREVALTAAGERLARASSEAMGLLRAALADITETDEGVLSITTLPSLAMHWLGPRLASFQLAWPEFAVRLEISTRIADLAHESLDVGVRAGPGEWLGLESHFLMPNIHVAVCAPEFRDRNGLAEPRDLLSAQRIGSDEDWAVWFAAAGIGEPPSGPAPRLRADTQTLEAAPALAGQGVALVSPVFFADEIGRGRLVQLFDVVATYSPGYWLVYPKERRRMRKIAAFRDWILARAAEDPVIGWYSS